MSLEIKTVEVSQSEKAAVISAHQSFGWILKSSQRIYSQSTTPEIYYRPYDGKAQITAKTETIDYTELIFERNKDLDNYGKLVELEDEYYHLELFLEDERPQLPKGVSTMEEWAKTTLPDLRNPYKTKRANILYFFLSALGLITFFLGWVAVIMNLNDPGAEEIATQIAGISCVIMLIVVCCMKPLIICSSERALRIALNSKHNKYHSELVNRYEDLIERIHKYDKIKTRMNEITREAKHLLA